MKSGLIYSIVCKSVSEAGDVDYSLNIDRVMGRLTVGSFPYTLSKDDFIVHQTYFDLDCNIHTGQILFTHSETGQILGKLNIQIDFTNGVRQSVGYAPPPVVIYEKTTILVQTFFDENLVAVYPLQID